MVHKHVMGIDFPNRVGLAAGLDKDGEYFPALSALGFGFVEIGTVTPKPQPGNGKPRLFRLPECEAIINRFGFNSGGVDALVERVRASDFSGVLGINIGKNKETSLANALDDYLLCMAKVYAYASYITVNISSPNTPDLRELQFGDYLKELLKGLKLKQEVLAERYQRYVPLVVKLSPDSTDDELKQMADVIVSAKIDGIIATNTTVDRAAISENHLAAEAGGLSGKPLLEKSLHVVNLLRSHLGKDFPIIGVGGISSPADAQAMLSAGADLLQIYSGLVYQGPGLIKKITQLNG